jgi:hypothetical protein
MADLWEVIADWEYPFGAIRFAIPIGTLCIWRYLAVTPKTLKIFSISLAHFVEL